MGILGPIYIIIYNVSLYISDGVSSAAAVTVVGASI